MIDATLISNANQGLCETSIGSITSLAGLSRGMVTYWFSSKSALLVAAYQQLLDEWSQGFFGKLPDYGKPEGFVRTNRLEAGQHPPYPAEVTKHFPFRQFKTSPKIIRLPLWHDLFLVQGEEAAIDALERVRL